MMHDDDDAWCGISVTSSSNWCGRNWGKASEFTTLYESENMYWSKIEVAVPMWLMTVLKIYKPVHEISNNVLCATSKASDQPAHMRSLIRAFATRLSIL